MANFKALPLNSQGNSEDVLYFNTEARPSDLYEAVTCRLENARDMLEVMACMNKVVDDRALPAISRAAAILLSDASGMLDALYDVVRRHEELLKDCAEMEAVAFQR